MQDFITIATFVFPSDMAVAKGRLESEGIECRVLDELTVQSYNFISNAIGGVKLQVSYADFESAQAILLEGGFTAAAESEPSFTERTLSNPKARKIIKIVLYSFLGMVVAFFLVMLIYN